MATHQLAHGLASLGRHGDSMLVHMQPQEVAGLQQLAQAHGTSLTINPHTGMPEAFSLGGFFSSLLPTIAGMAFAPATGGFSMTPLLAGAATGAGLAAIKGDNVLMGGLMGGMGGYGGSQLGPAFGATSGANVTPALEGTMAKIGGEGASSLLGTNTLQYQAPGMGGLNFAAKSTLPEINAEGMITQAGQGAGSASSGASAFNPMDNLSKSFSGMKNVAGFGDMPQADAWKAFKAAGGSGTTLGLTGAGAVLGGLEPTDLYGEPLKSDKDKYDPMARLNLGNDTGLRLYAVGGSITSNPSVGGGISDLYNRPEGQTTETLSNDGYGVGRLNSLSYEQAKEQAKTLGYAHGGYLNGAGDGMSDSIPATIEGKQPARLADGEFVVPADVVSHLGNGSSKAGSQRLYSMLDKVRKARTGHAKQGKQINPNKYLPA
jgi:hypothetical protein